MFKLLLLGAIVAASSASYLGGARHGYGAGYGYGATVLQKAYVAPVQEPATPYQMGYEVVDEEGNRHGRRESGDAAGNKVGSYNLVLANGLQRVVEYKADGAGFRAVIRSNEPGTDASQDPADVQQEAIGGYVHQARKVVAGAPSYGYGHVAGYGPRGGYGHGYARRAGYAKSYGRGHAGYGHLARY